MERELKVKTNWKGAGCKEEEGDPVSPTGQYWNSSALSISVLAVLEFEVPVHDLQAMQLIRDVFLPINPRLSSIMVSGKNGEKRWKKVEVDLEDHLNIPTFPSDLPLEQYDNHFNEYLTKVAMDPFPQDKPLWKIYLVTYPTSKGAGHVIFKLHHALGDGYSLMGALLSCLQRADDSSLPLTFPRRRGKPKLVGWHTRLITCIPKALHVAYNTLCDYGWSILKSSVIEDDKTPIRSGNEDLGHKPTEISTVELSLDKIKEIKAELGVTINDVVVGIIYNGVRLYMRGKSDNWASSDSTVLVLMNTRSIEGYTYKSVSDMLKTSSSGEKKLWGNQFAFLHTPVPKLSQNDEFHDPLKFVFEAQRIIQKKRSSIAFKLIAQTIEIIRMCAGPETAARYIHKTIRNTSFLLTNMVGPVEKMALADHPVKGIYFMVPGCPQSLTITVLTYMQTLRIGIGVEKNYMDLEEFKSSIEQAFELIYNAATMKGDKMKTS